MILLFYAFPREIAALRRRVPQRTALAHGGLRGFRAAIGGKEFSAVAHGIGMERARETARRALDLMPAVEMIIGTGVAGALSAGLRSGDLVMADRILALHAGADRAEHMAQSADAQIRSLGHWLRAAGLTYATGALLSSHRVMATGREKRQAKETTGAIAVDMETAALAAEAHARGIPFVAIRAVLDEVDDEVVGAEMTDEHGRVRPLAATAYLARNPSAMLKLPRLMRNLALAANSIADAIEAIAHEGQPPHRPTSRHPRAQPRRR